MDEEDSTLYINCRNRYSVETMWEFIKQLLSNVNIKYKETPYFKVLELQLEEDYISYVRFIDLENCNQKFLKEKYYLSDQDILDFMGKLEKEKNSNIFRFIFGNFIKGLN